MRKTLKLKDVFWHIFQPGDYAWEECCNHRLVLACPFCGNDAPIPYDVTVVNKEPLTIEEQLHCGFCTTAFHIRDGEAIRDDGGRDETSTSMPSLQTGAVQT